MANTCRVHRDSNGRITNVTVPKPITQSRLDFMSKYFGSQGINVVANATTMRQILRERGYDITAMAESYRGSHTAPVGSDGYSVSIDNLSDMYPDDVYSDLGWHYYGDGGEHRIMDKASHALLKSLKGRPDATVTVYRAVPKGVKNINSGDWVSINRDYAVQHGERTLDGKYDIITKELKASQIFTEGNSLHEQGVEFLATKAGEVYGFVDTDGTIYIDPSIATEATLLHEGSHLWRRALKTVAKVDPKAQAILDRWSELAKPIVDKIIAAKKGQTTSGSDLTFQILSEVGAARIDRYSQTLQQAKALEQEGVPYTEIESQTGWYKYQGQWRMLSSEMVQQFHIGEFEPDTPISLFELLPNATILREAYPELEDTKVVMVSDDYRGNLPKGFENSAGAYVQEDNTIYIPLQIPVQDGTFFDRRDEQLRDLLQKEFGVSPNDITIINRGDESNIKTLSQLLPNFQTLGNAYPALGEVQIEFVPKMGEESNENEVHYDSDTKTIRINMAKRTLSKGDLERNLGHEVLGHISEGSLSSPVYNQREGESDEEYRDRIEDEVLARAVGDNAKEYLDSLGFTEKETKTFLDRIAEFIKQFSEWLRGKVGFQDMTIDDIAKLSVRDFIDKATTSQLLGEFRNVEPHLGESTPSLVVNRSDSNNPDANIQLFSENSKFLLEPNDFLPNGEPKPEVLQEIAAERKAIKDKAIADGTFMLAPNGQPTNLTEDQWISVRSSRFLAWYGPYLKAYEEYTQGKYSTLQQSLRANDASQFVDLAGEPILFFHGTSKDSEFKSFKIPDNGTWFTNDLKSAEGYSRDNDSMKLKYDSFTGKYIEVNSNSRVIPVFLNVRNIKTIKEILTPSELENLKTARNYKSLQKQYFNRERFLKNNTDAISFDLSSDEVNFKSIAIIGNPNQIKSATNNVGTYSTTNNRIDFSIVGEKGAAALDKAEEATTRLDNLTTAREMETAGKDPLTIRIATGWERGVDNLWRHEIVDFELTPEVLDKTIRDKFTLKPDSYNLYIREVGEVEARNVQTRMTLTPEQRRQILLSETEDVAREDQIIIMSGLGLSDTEENSLFSKLSPTVEPGPPTESQKEEVKALVRSINTSANISFIDDPTQRFKGRITGSVIIINLAYADASTGVHEILGHPVIAHIKENEKELYDKLVEELNSTEEGKQILQEVSEAYPELDKDGQVEEAIVEYLSRLVDRRRIEPTSAFRRFIDRILEFVGELFGRQYNHIPTFSELSAELDDYIKGVERDFHRDIDAISEAFFRSNETVYNSKLPILETTNGQEGMKLLKKTFGETNSQKIRDLIPSAKIHAKTFVSLVKSLLVDESQAKKFVSDEENLLKINEQFEELLSKSGEVTEVEEFANPFELAKSVGYTLTQAKTAEDMAFFKKDYKHGYTICTFNDGTGMGRLGQSHILWLRRDYASDILPYNMLTQEYLHTESKDAEAWREYLKEKGNYDEATDTYKIPTKPSIRDPYAISSVSVQFSKGNAEVGRKMVNRYNHHVDSVDGTADAAFQNNLDNVAPNLNRSLRNYLGIKMGSGGRNYSQNIVHTNDDKLFVSDRELNDIYISDVGYVENGEYHKVDKNTQLLTSDGVLFDFKKNSINNITNGGANRNFNLALSTGVISVTRKGDIITLFTRNEDKVEMKVEGSDVIEYYDDSDATKFVTTLLDRNLRLRSLDMPNVEEIPDKFLSTNLHLNNLNLPKVTKIGDDFLMNNEALTHINMPNLREVGDDFLMNNEALTHINMPNLREVGDDFLMDNKALTHINMPNLREVGDDFLMNNEALTHINMPNLREVGEDFLYFNRTIESFNMDNIETIGSGFMLNNRGIVNLSMKNVKNIPSKFMTRNDKLETVDLPNVINIGDSFLSQGISVKSVNLPKVEVIKDSFMHGNKEMISINLPNVESIGYDFISENTKLELAILPKLKRLKNGFMSHNIKLKYVNFENVTIIENFVLDNNREATLVNLPKVTSIGSKVLVLNNTVEQLNLPEVLEIGNYFMLSNRVVKSISAPKVESIQWGFTSFNLEAKDIAGKERVVIENGVYDFYTVYNKSPAVTPDNSNDTLVRVTTKEGTKNVLRSSLNVEVTVDGDKVTLPSGEEVLEVSAPRTEMTSETFKQLNNIPGVTEEQALDMYKNLYADDLDVDWLNEDNTDCF